MSRYYVTLDTIFASNIFHNILLCFRTLPIFLLYYKFELFVSSQTVYSVHTSVKFVHQITPVSGTTYLYIRLILTHCFKEIPWKHPPLTSSTTPVSFVTPDIEKSK